MPGTANVLQEMPNPETNVSARCSRRVRVLCDDVALNAHALKWRFNWPRPLAIWNEVIARMALKTSNAEKLIASQRSKWGKILAIVGPRAFLILQSLERSVVGRTLTRWLGDRSYQPCMLTLHWNRHTRGIFYLQSLAICLPDLPMTEFSQFTLLYIVHVMSFFGALYTTTAAKITISVHCWSK
jgi:hypothetical protein